MTTFGVNTLLQSDNAANTIPSGAVAYNSPERIEFAKGWIDDAAEIGSQVIRYPGDWIGLEGAGKGQFANDYVQETIAVIEYAASKGIEVIYEFGQTPPWAKPDGIDEGAFTPPKNVQDYADAVSYLHQQFVAGGVADNISGWEIWNEPNANLGWPTGTYRNPLDQNQGIDPAVDEQAAREYVDLLNKAYDALKAVDADVTVLGGSLAGTDFEYLGWMLDAGAKFDGLAVHPYTRNFDNPEFLASQSTAPARPRDDPRAFDEGQGLDRSLNERFSFEYGLTELRTMLDENGRSDTSLYLTEIGWGVGPQGTLSVESFEMQADYLREALEVTRDLGNIEVLTYFQLYDFTDGQVGLLDDAGNLRPSAEVFRQFIEENSGALPLDTTTTETIARIADPNADFTLEDDPAPIAAAATAVDFDASPDAASASDVTISGTGFNDVIVDGTNGRDVISAGEGSDFIDGSAGNDTIFGDVAGSSDYDQVNYRGVGSRAENFTFVRNADGSITASSPQFGSDTWYGIDGVYFEAENQWYPVSRLIDQDALASAAPTEVRNGDVVLGSGGGQTLVGTASDDLIRAGAGDDVIIGGTGDDRIVGDPNLGANGFDRVEYLGAGSERSDFIFSINEAGMLVATSDAFGTDLLTRIDALYFGEDDVIVDVDDLF